MSDLTVWSNGVLTGVFMAVGAGVGAATVHAYYSGKRLLRDMAAMKEETEERGTKIPFFKQIDPTDAECRALLMPLVRAGYMVSYIRPSPVYAYLCVMCGGFSRPTDAEKFLCDHCGYEHERRD